MKKTITAVILFIATQFIGTAIAALILIIPRLSELQAEDGMGFWQMMDENMIPITVIGLLLSYIMLTAIFLSMRYFKPADLIKRVPENIFWISIPLIIVAMYAMNMLNSAFHLPNIKEEAFTKIADSTAGFLTIALFGPIMEEIVFRRIIIDDCVRRTGKKWAAILISAALFGLIHMNPAQMLFAFLIGLLFGWVYVCSGSMLPGIIGHIINNTVAVLGMRYFADNEFISGDMDFTDSAHLAIFNVCLIAAVLLAVKFDQECRRQEKASQSDSGTLEGIE